MQKSFDCTIVVLSYNTREITESCLRRIALSAKNAQKALGAKTTTVVVDSASTDGSQTMVVTKFPSVRLVRLSKNKGPGPGYNAGMKLAKTPYILILNSDTYLAHDTLTKTLGHMQSHPDCDGLMCKKVDGTGQFEEYCGNIPTPARTIRWLLGMESLPILRDHISRIYGYPDSAYKKAFRIGWMPTFFFLMKREVYTKTGGHDENIFLYMDDVEWFKRIEDAGFKIWYTPIATVVHLGGSSTKKKNVGYHFLLANQVKSIAYMQKKHYPQEWWLVSIFLFLGLKVRAITHLLMGHVVLAHAYWSV